MHLYEVLTIIISLAAILAYVNYRFIRLPTTIGIMVLSMVLSLGILGLGKWFPSLLFSVVEMVKSLDFYDLLINIMLSFLLFAGSIHVLKAITVKVSLHQQKPICNSFLVAQFF